MRFGVNALYLIPGGVGGTEIYLRNLLRALAVTGSAHEWFVFTNEETEPAFVPDGMVGVPLGVRAQNRPGRLIQEQTVLPARARALGLDAMLNPGFTAPVLTSCPNVTVFHDLQHKRHPEHFRWFDKPAWDAFLWLAVRSSKLLLADSEATARDLIRFYDVKADRVRVALLGVEDEFFRIAESRGPVRPFVLCASTLHPHKNIERLVRVFARFRERRPEFELVLAGMRGFNAESVEAEVARQGLQQHVRITGWIPRAELYELFRQATAFIYPSTFEGFGLPVVEAMAAGVPLACSDVEPLRSLTADGAVRFRPDSDDEMLGALLRVTESSELVEKGRIRAAQFTWKKCAEVTLGALVDAASGR